MTFGGRGFASAMLGQINTAADQLDGGDVYGMHGTLETEGELETESRGAFNRKQPVGTI